MMARLRSQPPKEIAGMAVARMGDGLTGEIREMSAGRLVGRYDLPTSDVIVFTLAEGSKVIARPSGTEPKIKFYILIREPADDLDQAVARAQAKISALTTAIDQLAQ